ncbi:S8 family serine peptidase [Oceanobacillus massiliensis]|uniref:S8 family serine peptidase n=1 Tax=Oceanobacillus massiliensis TaxID=1465765 RepID=UPI000287A6DE|nr:S8 family serine peptidase [Oceanobacillus massiliensis]
MRKFIITLILLLIIPSAIHAEEDLQSIIIEVEGDPSEHKEYIEAYHPFIEVVAVYDTLFNGLALQGSPANLEKMESLEFIKSIHTVQQYEALEWSSATQRYGSFSWNSANSEIEQAIQPNDINTTQYTGKGVKVGVIDTGIDYEHPDLKNNYQSGYDLVDLDDDPMESLPEQGVPTSHGTHVAGIIAADGDIKGVAPDAQIYSYRALGPGGAGTSVQVIAAMEKAIEDEVDVINLSLGNNVNVPDYPTSMAVNRASEMGITVVIANGNSGPDDWTVGSPATADQALSVGASTMPMQVPFLYDTLEDKSIQLSEMIGSPPWEIIRSNQLIEAEAGTDVSLSGKIALIQRGRIPFYELAKTAEEKGAIAAVIYNNEDGPFQGSVDNEKDPLNIPVATVSKEDGEWLKTQASKQPFYIETSYLDQGSTTAPFSSRGPVTVNWNIKPDVLAPGTAIWSTVPGGYQQMDGTSMAAPHVTGAVALIKEAHPEWTREQIIGALKTTADHLKEQDASIPTIQGMGEIQPKAAIDTATIIHNPQLNLGMVDNYREELRYELEIENMTGESQTYSFTYPKKKKGLSWDIPASFTLEANEKRSIPITLNVTTTRLEEGVHQDWLTLNQEGQKYHLPYIFVNQHADQPKTAGFEFTLKGFSDDVYHYSIYTTEPARRMEVDLYNPESLQFERKLLESEELETGLHEGEITKKEAGKSGYYLAIVTVYLEDGSYETNQSLIYIE